MTSAGDRLYGEQTVYPLLVRGPGERDFAFSAVFGSREDAQGYVQSLNMAQVDPPIDEMSDEVWQMANGTQFKIEAKPLLSFPF